MTDYNDKIKSLCLTELMMEWKHINESIKENNTALKVLLDQEKFIEENITLRDKLLTAIRHAPHDKLIEENIKFSDKTLSDKNILCRWDIESVKRVGHTFEIYYNQRFTVTIDETTFKLIKQNPDCFALSAFGIIDLTLELKPIFCFIDGKPTEEIRISAEAIKDNLYVEDFPKQANTFGENIEEGGVSEEEIQASKAKIWNDHQKAMVKSKKLTQKSILKNLNNNSHFFGGLSMNQFVARKNVDQTGREIDLDTELKYVCFIDNNIQNSKVIALLAKHEVTHINQLVRLDEPSLLRWRRMGPNTVGLINTFLQDNRLKLGMTNQEIDA